MGNFFKKLGACLSDLFTSKKFLTAAGGVVAAIASGTPVGTAVLAAGGSYIVAQGIADHGKSAAQIQATTTARKVVLDD